MSLFGRHEQPSELALDIGGQAPEDWESLLAADPAADFFHTRTWTDSVGRCYPDKTPLWLSVRVGERLAAGLSVLHTEGGRVDLLESSLEGTSGGPLVAADLPHDFADTLFRLLIDHVHHLRSGLLGSISLSLNSAHEERFGPVLADDTRWQRHSHPAAVISLEGGIEAVEMQRLKKNKRNERNRAQKRGVEVLVTRDPEKVAAYYPIYLAATQAWGVRPAPLEFLQDLLLTTTEEDASRGHAFFTCVQVDGRVIGGHLNLVYGDRVIAWNGVTDPEFGRTHFPATAAIWGDLQESCRLGARWLDLGGSGGVIKLEDFKRSFGAEEQTRGWYTCDTLGLRLMKSGRDTWRRLSSPQGAGA